MWSDLELTDPAKLTVVVEPTRNAWIVVAEWFRRRGARVVMVPTTQAADLRKYYSKHTKNDGSTLNCWATPAAASRRIARVLRPGTGRSELMGSAHDDQAPYCGPRQAGCVDRTSRPGLVRGAGLELRHRRVGVPGSLRRPARGDPARPRAPDAVPHRALTWSVASGPRRRPPRCRERDPDAGTPAESTGWILPSSPKTSRTRPSRRCS